MPKLQAAKARAIFRILARTYPAARCALKFRTPFQLVAATILSAQCTDKKVIQVTPSLFRIYPDPAAMARAPLRRIEGIIRGLGLFHAKAKSLKGAAKMLKERFQGEVPRTMEALVALPGVGRKTANVVLYNAFGLPGLAVDTHVLRVGQRLGLHGGGSPEKAEGQLKKILPARQWGQASHLLIAHGRAVCKARNPDCPVCPLRGLCPYYRKTKKAG